MLARNQHAEAYCRLSSEGIQVHYKARVAVMVYLQLPSERNCLMPFVLVKRYAEGRCKHVGVVVVPGRADAQREGVGVKGFPQA